MKRIKIYLSLLLVIVILSVAYAEELPPLTKNALLAMSKSELLTTLKIYGLLLPEDYAAHPELAENFVYHYTPLIMDSTVDASSMAFSYDQSQELLINLCDVLAALGLSSETE